MTELDANLKEYYQRDRKFFRRVIELEKEEEDKHEKNKLTESRTKELQRD